MEFAGSYPKKRTWKIIVVLYTTWIVLSIAINEIVSYFKGKV